MIKDRNTLDYIFTLVKQVKKPFVKIYPNGTIIGTDEQFASLNILIPEVICYNISIPYIFKTSEISAFMREIGGCNNLIYDPYEITMIDGKEKSTLYNHAELSFKFDELYGRTLNIQSYPLIYQQENFQTLVPEMFSMKVSDGAKMYSFQTFLMSSFNAIHPSNKTDRVDLIIRDCDYYSYIAQFIIYKKKDKYQLHEYLRFRKL